MRGSRIPNAYVYLLLKVGVTGTVAGSRRSQPIVFPADNFSWTSVENALLEYVMNAIAATSFAQATNQVGLTPFSQWIRVPKKL